jgi:hypothetical protein
MRINLVSRAAVVVASIGAVALLGLSAPSDAARQGQSGKDRRAKQNEQKKQDREESKQRHQQQVDQQQQRLAQYDEHLNQQQRLAESQAAQLQQQNRRAQLRVQQQYAARLHEQQLTVHRQAPARYANDKYFSTPSTYRYTRDGRSYETNQYGVTLLRQAVNYGYDQGYRTGQADMQDRSMSNYEDSFAYRDANYGYQGFYVDRDDYNSYFREGFRRGYEDGYGRRAQYGTYVNGRGTVLSAILGSVLNLQVILR